MPRVRRAKVAITSRVVRAAPVLVLLAAGCTTTFLPTYDQALFTALDSANQEIAKIDAATDAVLTPPPTFDKLEPYYTSAFANLSRARMIAEAKYAGVSKRPSANAAKLIVDAVVGCQTALTTLMAFNKGRALSHETFQQSLIAENCDVPKVMATRLPKGNK